MKIHFHIGEIKRAAELLWAGYQHKKLWAFYAEMGAGKTTFIHALCDYLQVTDAVSSPTFSIINEYKSPMAGTIFHMDWYRIKGEEEAINAGVEDCLLSGNLCLIEWPQKAQGILPDDAIRISISTMDDFVRVVEVGDAAIKDEP